MKKLFVLTVSAISLTLASCATTGKSCCGTCGGSCGAADKVECAKKCAKGCHCTASCSKH